MLLPSQIAGIYVLLCIASRLCAEATRMAPFCQLAQPIQAVYLHATCPTWSDLSCVWCLMHCVTFLGGLSFCMHEATYSKGSGQSKHAASSPQKS